MTRSTDRINRQQAGSCVLERGQISYAPTRIAADAYSLCSLPNANQLGDTRVSHLTGVPMAMPISTKVDGSLVISSGLLRCIEGE